MRKSTKKNLVIYIFLFVCLLIFTAFFYARRQISNTPVPVVPTQPERIELSMLKQLPVEEKVILFKEIPHSQNSKILAVTNSGAAERDELGNERARANIWILSADNGGPRLLKQHIFQAYYLSDVGVRWDHDDYSDGGLGSLEIQFVVLGEGPFSWSEIAHDYIDIGDERVIASTSWVDNFHPELLLETGDKKYLLGFNAKNGCRKEYTDLAIGIVVNGQELRFIKPHKISCPVFGEDDGHPTLPGLGAPYFHGRYKASFNLPWGTIVEIDLTDGSIRSKDFVKEYSLPEI